MRSGYPFLRMQRNSPGWPFSIRRRKAGEMTA
jgi:hypothetical protein